MAKLIPTGFSAARRIGLILGMLLLLAPQAGQALVPVVDNGCPNLAGQQQPFCSKLGSGERITVQATECGYSIDNSARNACGAVSPDICRTIINDSGVDYFVPWKDPAEWGAFLSQLSPMSPMVAGATPLPGKPLVSILPGVTVGACCPPQKADPICPGYPCEVGMAGYPNCSILGAHGVPDDLGYRKVGTRTGILLNYGAQNDVFGPIKSSELFGDSGINYEVTYTCSNGSWVKSYEVGSCTPADGQCNAALPKPLPYGWTLPTDLNTLCNVAAGSTIVDNSLVDKPASVSWMCQGTPGKAIVPCARDKTQTPSSDNGACGSAKGKSLATPPTGASQKCASGTPTAVVGMGTQSSPWTWSCNGQNGGTNDNSCYAYLLGTPLDGICGSANGYVATAANWVPTPAQMCAQTATPPLGVPTGNQLNWICTASGGGNDASCSATLKSVDGVCGVDNSYVVTKAPHDPPNISDLPPNACAKGTPVNITYDSGTMTLHWNCAGQNGGNGTDCSAHVDPGLQKGICTWPLGTVLPAVPPATSASLCLSGTAANIVTTGVSPTIGITWMCLGSVPGYDAVCGVAVHIPTNGNCGAANGQQLDTKPFLPGDLCTVGAPSAVSGGATGPNWGWSCAGIYGGLTAYCGAVYSTTPGGPGTAVDGVCNAAKMVPQASKPTAPLCDIGTPTAVGGTGPWTWQCLGLFGGAPANCLAPIIGSGACGATAGTRIPNKPNSNLCSVGNPSPVTGDNITGWNWSCTGTATVPCHADPCDICSGDLPPLPKSDALANQTINYGSGTCAVKGTVDWTEVDTLNPSNTAYTIKLSNDTAALNYQKAQLPSSAPANYCTPCYRNPKALSAGVFTVQKQTTGVCTTGTALDVNGNIVTIGVTSATIE